MKVKEDGTKVKKAPEEWRKMQKPKTFVFWSWSR